MRGGRHCREDAEGEVEVDGTRAKERSRRTIQGRAGVELEFEVEGNRGRGSPRRRWGECLKEDMEMRDLEDTDAQKRNGRIVGSRTADPKTKADRTR